MVLCHKGKGQDKDQVQGEEEEGLWELIQVVVVTVVVEVIVVGEVSHDRDHNHLIDSNGRKTGGVGWG